MRAISSFLIGLLFGAGLWISGMTRPEKVLGFLDLAGPWDPSLAFVMGGAIAVGLVGFALAKRRERAALGEPIRLPTRRDIDRRLIVGAILFGAGWGLGGICPGPAIAILGADGAKALAFCAAMLAGMGIFELGERRGWSLRAR